MDGTGLARSTDCEWIEFDRVQWLHDNLSPQAADALARLITEDADAS